MNRQDVLQLNVIPDGKEAWLAYEQYLRLKQLFEALPLPDATETTTNQPPLSATPPISEQCGPIGLALE